MKEITDKKIRMVVNFARNHKRILPVAIVPVIAICILASSLVSNHSNADTQKYEDGEATKVNMVQTLTAAGEITAGSSKSISFSTSRTFKAMCVEENEPVEKGQHLIAYADGTYEDAPSNGVVTAINAPETGTVADSDCTLTFGNTDTLVLDITIPEDEINSVKKGDTATVVVNADTTKSYTGEIISKKELSTTLLAATDNSDESGSNDGSSAGSDADKGTPSGQGGDPFGSNSSTAYYTVRIKMINDGYVLVGMSAGCTITISDRTEVLSVPVEAVYFTAKGKAYVKVPDGDKTKRVYVKLGESDASNVEIKSGLKEGTVVKVPVQT